MVHSLKEWSSNDKLPKGFSEWLNELVDEKENIEGTGFSRITKDLGVQAPILSRWLGGMGPLSQNDIKQLSSKLGAVVYTYLHVPRPEDID